MVDRCMCAMGEVVERFGGAIDKVIGDALMAVFGAPVAHEDDPTRAVRAALEIQRRASENAEEFCGLCVRVGVNSGEVIFARGRSRGAARADRDGRCGEHRGAASGGRAGCKGCWSASRRMPRPRTTSSTKRWRRCTAKGKSAPLQAWLARSAAAAPSRTPCVERAIRRARDRSWSSLARAWARTSSERQSTAGHRRGRSRDRQDAAGPRAGAPNSGRGRTRAARALAPVWGARRVRRARAGRQGGVRHLRQRRGRLRRVAKLARRARARCSATTTRSSVATHLSIVARLTEDTRRGARGAVRLGAAFPRGART